MSNTHLIDIFKVGIYQVQLDIDNQKLYDFCKNHQTHDEGRVISNVGGYQSNFLNFQDKLLQPLSKEIEKHSTKYLKDVLKGHWSQSLSDMWININNYKDTNLVHNHPGSEISGVYYVKVPQNSGCIVFRHPASSELNHYYYNTMNLGEREWDSYTASHWEMPVTERVLYLFPSWLNHYVSPSHNKTEERISLAFNTYHKGE